MKRFLLPHFCRPIGIAVWLVAIIWGFGLIYDWVHTTPQWAYALLGPRLQEESFEFPIWSRLIYDRVQTTAPNGELCWYGDTAAPHLFNPLLALAIYIGAALIFFSKEKIEDEMAISKRLHSLMIAFAINISLLIIGYACVFLPSGIPTFLVQIIVNNFAIFMIILPTVYIIQRWLDNRNLKEEIIL